MARLVVVSNRVSIPDGISRAGNQFYAVRIAQIAVTEDEGIVAIEKDCGFEHLEGIICLARALGSVRDENYQRTGTLYDANC